MTDSPEDYVQRITDDFINLLQTIKIMFVDLPADAAREFFDLIPLAMKTPKLFKLAATNLAKYDNYNIYGYQGASTSAMGLLNNFMNMMGTGAGFGYPGQPVYQQPQMMNGAAPMYGASPFGYPGASNQYAQQPMMGGYQPAAQGYQYNPAAPVAPQPVAPEAQAQAAAPVPAAETTVTTNVQA